MNLPAGLRTVRWMVWDTVRQSLSTKLFWVMTAAAAVAILFCLSVRVTGDARVALPEGVPDIRIPKREAERLGPDKVDVPVVSGEVSVGFGLMTVPLGRSREDAVQFLQLMIAGGVADTLGVLLALLWTAGFLPTFLEPQSASVLLSKPSPRWAILVGKYLGVVGFVAVQAVMFIGGTWLALGLVTGVWTGAYWLAVPLLVTNFAVFYAVSAFLAVWTRSTVAAAFGTLLFWIVCWTINYVHWKFVQIGPAGLSSSGSFFVDMAYWLFPKPLDFGGIFHETMNAGGFSVMVPELANAREAGKFFPAASVGSSLAFSAAALAVAGYEFEQAEY
jgi:hypothetical protein